MCYCSQACLDLEPFVAGSQYVPGSTFNLTSAPVLFHLEHDPSLYTEIEAGVESVQNVDYEKVSACIYFAGNITGFCHLEKKFSQSFSMFIDIYLQY